MKKTVIFERRETDAMPKNTCCPTCKLPLQTGFETEIGDKKLYYCANNIDGRTCGGEITQLIAKINLKVSKT